jgi:hypothetical protein
MDVPTGAGHHLEARARRGGDRRPSRLVRVGLVVLTVGLCAAVVTGCMWKPMAVRPDGTPVRRSCVAGVSNTVRVDPARLSAGQVADIVAAVAELRRDSGVPLVAVVGAVPAGDRAGIVVRQGVVVDPRNNQRHAGMSQPFDDDRDGVYDRGLVLLDDWQGLYPTGRRWGDWQRNYFKLAYHELAHQLGLADVYAPNGGTNGGSWREMMGNHLVPRLGAGDRYGMAQVGCAPVARR